MRLFKYMPPESAQRFIDTWALRLTPPDQFNDPFEMRPPLDFVTNNDILSAKSLADELPRRCAEDFVRKGFPWMAEGPLPQLLVSYAMGEISRKDERRLMEFFPVQIRSHMQKQLPGMRAQFRAGLAEAQKMLPVVSTLLETKLHDMVPQHLGVLCLTRSGNHTLMWAHYADEHRGAVVEFDETAACFNRRRSEEDDLGTFRPVVYSDSRPELRFDTEEGIFEILALTKAAEWAYEEEERLLWPLKMCDRTVNESIHLLSIPPSTVLSVTFGCRASKALVDDIRSRLRETSETRHIDLRRAELDPRRFALRYMPIPG